MEKVRPRPANLILMPLASSGSAKEVSRVFAHPRVPTTLLFDKGSRHSVCPAPQAHRRERRWKKLQCFYVWVMNIRSHARQILKEPFPAFFQCKKRVESNNIFISKKALTFCVCLNFARSPSVSMKFFNNRIRSLFKKHILKFFTFI